MITASAYSILPDSAAAALAAAESLVAALGPRIDLVVVYTTEHHATAPMLDALRPTLPGAAMVGVTPCLGVMTGAACHTSPDGAVGLFGIADAAGSYGEGSCLLADGAEHACAARSEEYPSAVRSSIRMTYPDVV